MEKFPEVMGPVSWLIFSVCFLASFFIVFRPTLTEYLVMLAVDIGTLLYVFPIDKWFFVRIFPQTKLFFPDFDWKAIEKTSVEEKAQLVQRLVEFPKLRATFCALVTILKVTPATLVIVFYWEHERSNSLQFVLSLSLTLLSNSYFYGAVYIETHDLVSRKIADLHKRVGLAEVFRRLQLGSRGENFRSQEIISLLAIWVSLMLVQSVVIATASVPARDLLPEITAIGLGGMILFARVWYLGRQYFIGGLENLFHSFETFDPKKFGDVIPLHSSPILARFESIFNALMERLRSYERELSHWVFQKSEESRYRALGEVSALVVHDLSGPLHVIQFCIQELKENPKLLEDSRYMEQLTISGDRAQELVSSLREFLRRPVGKTGSASLNESYIAVKRLLETRFLSEGFSRVVFEVDPKVSSVVVRTSKPDMIHILMNLLSNSLSNMLSNQILDPKITLRVEEQSAESVMISIHDTGTGLGKERFELLTGLVIPQQTDGVSGSGLGLRLIRRLIERNGGSLDLCDLPANEPGTLFHLRLPVGG